MKLTKEQDKQLKKLINEITNEAKKVVDDYIDNPSKISGSVEIHIHEESPWLNEKEKFIPLTKKRKKNVN
jgi:hypothetical protein